MQGFVTTVVAVDAGVTFVFVLIFEDLSISNFLKTNVSRVSFFVVKDGAS